MATSSDAVERPPDSEPAAAEPAVERAGAAVRGAAAEQAGAGHSSLGSQSPGSHSPGSQSPGDRSPGYPVAGRDTGPLKLGLSGLGKWIAASQVAYTFLGTFGIPTALGVWLDHEWATRPWGTVIGLGVGLSLATALAYRQTLAASARRSAPRAAARLAEGGMEAPRRVDPPEDGDSQAAAAPSPAAKWSAASPPEAQSTGPVRRVAGAGERGSAFASARLDRQRDSSDSTES